MITARNKTNHNITIDNVVIKPKETYSWVEFDLPSRTRTAIQNAQNVGWIDVFIYPDPKEELGIHDHDHMYIIESIPSQEEVVEENKPKRKTKKEE